MTATANPLLRKFAAFARLTREESAFLAAWTDQPMAVQATAELVRPHHMEADVYVLMGGWACRYKLLPDGRRQIFNFVLPGDFIGMRAHLFGMADHSITMLTDGHVAAIPAERIVDLYQTHPRLAAAMTWSATHEEAMLAEQIVRLGRRTAYERLAHLFMELLTRLRLVGRASATSYAFPVTQETLADLLGLSVVHVNRTLRALRRDGLINHGGGDLCIRDPRALALVAAFDADPIINSTMPRLPRRALERLKPAAGQRK